AEQNKVVATIGVYGRPYFIEVSPDGHRAYVANSGSDNVSVLDLDRRAVAATNRADNSVSILDTARLAVRSAINICINPEDIAILPDSSKAFVSCSGSGQVASIALKNQTQNAKLLALLDVG